MSLRKGTAEGSNNSNPSTKHRNKSKTLEALQYAIARLEMAGSKITISSVARDADVTPALIHNTYPDVAEKIRQLIGKATRTQRNAQHTQAKRQVEITRELQEEITKLKADYADLASANLTLQIELDHLKAVGRSNVTSLPS